MSKRNLLNLGLLVCAISLAALSFFQPGSRQNAPKPTLTKIQPTQIKDITIQFRDDKPVHFTHLNDSWIYEEMGNNKILDDSRISVILSLAQAPSLRKFDASNLDLGKYELDHPKLKVAFNQTNLLFGGNDPVNGRRYILVDNTVHLINDVYYGFLLSPVETFFVK